MDQNIPTPNAPAKTGPPNDPKTVVAAPELCLCRASLDGLPSTGFIREPKVLELLPMSRSQWWAGIAEGRYPKGIKLSKRITAWSVESIRKLIADLKAQ